MIGASLWDVGLTPGNRKVDPSFVRELCSQSNVLTIPSEESKDHCARKCGSLLKVKILTSWKATYALSSPDFVFRASLIWVSPF